MKLFVGWYSAMTSFDSRKASSFIEKNEGREYKYYKDTLGNLTIGVGFNLEEGLSDDEIDFILSSRIQEHYDDLHVMVAEFKHLCFARKLVLIDMSYNMGIHKLLQFENMLDAIRDKDWQKAAGELLDSRYASQVGRRADRNADILRSGELT